MGSRPNRAGDPHLLHEGLRGVLVLVLTTAALSLAGFLVAVLVTTVVD